MISLFSVLNFASAAAAVVAYLIGQRKPKNFPPGPWGFPILGHLPNLGLEPHKTAIAWIPTYGPIVGVDFGSFPCVIISDYKLCREAFSEFAFCGRPKFAVFARRSGGQPEGLAFTSGAVWREQRAFAVRRLKQLGFGTKSMEDIILSQAQDLVQALREGAGSPLGTRTVLTVATWNIIWVLITGGEPFAHSDPEIRKFIALVVDGLSDVNVFTMLSMMIPWFANHFPYWVTQDNRLDNVFRDARALFKPYLDKHWATRVAGHPRDFIDAYIDEIEGASSRPDSSFHGDHGKQGLMATLLDLFVAGVETTGATLSWVCLLLALYPKVQERLAAEIRTVLGVARLPSLTDRGSLPYVEAVLHEVMRFRTLVPFSVFHSTEEPVHFHGYDIPKDTMIYINVHEAHNNREVWGDPENFRPERFLDDRGQFTRREGFMAFGTGKRVCIGEQLARDDLFLFTTSVFQMLKVGPVPGEAAPSLEPKLGGSTMIPKPHQLVFSIRHDEQSPE